MAATSAASTRPCASASAACSLDSRAAPARTRASASATDINATLLLHAIGSRLAPAFLDQADAVDAHPALDRLHHVVDGEAGHRNRGQRFHLDPGLPGDLDGGAHDQARQGAV